MKTPFSYSLVRYVHDPVAEEFVNVGVVVYAPDVRYLRARCTRRYGRASRFFGGVERQHFVSMMAHVERVLGSESRAVRGFPFKAGPADAFGVIRSLFSIDDSSLQFVDGGGGLTRDPEITLEELYDRFVGRYEAESRPRRDDTDVWRDVRRTLEARGVAERLQPYMVEAQHFSFEFAHSVKNGKWHAIEAVSFDLAEADSLREKAIRWVGRTQALRDGAQDLRIVYVTAPPTQQNLESAYLDALEILDGLSAIDHRIVDEKNANELAEDLARQLEGRD